MSVVANQNQSLMTNLLDQEHELFFRNQVWNGRPWPKLKIHAFLYMCTLFHA